MNAIETGLSLPVTSARPRLPIRTARRLGFAAVVCVAMVAGIAAHAAPAAAHTSVSRAGMPTAYVVSVQPNSLGGPDTM